MSQRLNFIDIAKGIGIILVVLSHTDYSNIVHYALAFYVPIFFFCSGYTTSPMTTEAGMKQNFVKHATKLIKPYIFFNLLLTLIFHQFYLQGFIGVFYSRYCLFPLSSPEPYRFFINGNYPLWFFTCMTIAYLFFYIIIYAPRRYQYYIAVSYIVITALLDYLPILLPWSIDTAFLMALFMFIGMETRQRIPTLYQPLKPHPIVLTAIIIYLLLLPFCDNINISVREYGASLGTFLTASVAGCIAVIYFARLAEGTIVGRCLQLLGRHTLTIFCIEIPFIVLVGRPIARFLLSGCLPSLWTSVATALIEGSFAIVGGVILSVILQQNKLLRKFVYDR